MALTFLPKLKITLGLDWFSDGLMFFFLFILKNHKDSKSADKWPN